jgi:alpha/beta superfamily hydrolase
MEEAPVFFQSENLLIEGLLNNLPGEKAVVVTHPHPLYGGDMHSPVVQTLVTAYNESGYSSLRFNFRGTGQSQGHYDEGRGEQKDVEAALQYMADLGKKQIDLAGYSFGAWVNARGLEKMEYASRLIMVSPPVGFLDFSFMRKNDKIKLIIGGSRDEIAPVSTVKNMIQEWNKEAQLEIIQGADHFYGHHVQEIETIVRNFLIGT